MRLTTIVKSNSLGHTLCSTLLLARSITPVLATSAGSIGHQLEPVRIQHRAGLAHHAHQGVLANDPNQDRRTTSTDDEPMQGRTNPFGMDPSVNVLGGRLEQAGTQPMTGFFRDGYCNTADADQGSHTVAAVVSPKWLDFSARRGNDLRGILSGGCTWCLCVSRWKESFNAFQRGEVDRETVPQVILEASHERALEKVSLDDLRSFAIPHPNQARQGLPNDPAKGGPIR